MNVEYTQHRESARYHTRRSKRMITWRPF